MSKEKIAKAKEYIMSQGRLKLKGLDKPVEKNPQAFLARFFSHYNKKLETLHCSNGQVQCMPGARRSIQDIYLIILHYYPKASLTKLYVELLKLISQDKVVSAICKAIHKRVYRGTNSGEKGFLNSTLTDEFGIDLKIIKSGETKLYSECVRNEGGWGQNYTRNDLKFIDT